MTFPSHPDVLFSKERSARPESLMLNLSLPETPGFKTRPSRCPSWLRAQEAPQAGASPGSCSELWLLVPQLPEQKQAAGRDPRASGTAVTQWQWRWAEWHPRRQQRQPHTARGRKDFKPTWLLWKGQKQFGFFQFLPLVFIFSAKCCETVQWK